MVHKVLLICAVLSPMGSIIAQNNHSAAAAIMAKSVITSGITSDVTSAAAIKQSLSGALPAVFSNQIVRWSQPKTTRGVLKGWYANGILAIDAAYYRNKFHGNYKSYYTNGHLKDAGQMVNGVPHGEWKTWYADGKPQSTRFFDAQKLAMAASAVKKRNPKLAFSPLAMQALKHPAAYQAALSPAQAYASLTRHHHGYDAPFAKCLQHGHFETHFANGKMIETGSFKDGLKDGLWQYWDEKGHLVLSGFYLHGHRVGAWKHYNASGKLISLSEYQNGAVIHVKKY